jgi:hypothetical protein
MYPGCYASLNDKLDARTNARCIEVTFIEGGIEVSFGHQCISLSHSIVMHWGVVICKIMCQTLKSWAPVNMKLALIDSIFDPVKMHIHCPCLFLLDVGVTISCYGVLYDFNGVSGR